MREMHSNLEIQRESPLKGVARKSVEPSELVDDAIELKDFNKDHIALVLQVLVRLLGP